MNIFFIQLTIVLGLTLDLGKCQPEVTGRCGKPLLPPHATKHLVNPEKSRFDNKERVIVLCHKKEFILNQHKLVCNNSRWTGKKPRCGRNMDAQVTHLDIFDCDSPDNRLLLTQHLNQSLETITGDRVPHNAFHRLRIDNSTKISANSSKCYTFQITFDRKIQYWFLTIDLWAMASNAFMSKVTPFVNKYRSCELRSNATQVDTSVPNETFSYLGYYFICDLKSSSDYKNEQSELSNVLRFEVKTNVTGELGLEAIFIGDLFTSGTRVIEPECGEIQIENIGVEIAEDNGFTYITCNDSFIDLNKDNIKDYSKNGNPKHKFTCNWNGEWAGSWPQCYPKSTSTCSKDIILNDKSKSVVIEEIGNVYYLNESQWFAINDSYVRYSCVNENDILVGKNIRTCLKNGKWSSKTPYCVPTGISGFAIAGILFAVLVVFVSIVLFVFRMYSKRVKRELRETKSEIEETNRKRYSEEFYADIKDEDTYEASDTFRKTMDYESVDAYAEYNDNTPRYQMEPLNKPNLPVPEYLDMFEATRH